MNFRPKYEKNAKWFHEISSQSNLVAIIIFKLSFCYNIAFGAFDLFIL